MLAPVHVLGAESSPASFAVGLAAVILGGVAVATGIAVAVVRDLLVRYLPNQSGMSAQAASQSLESIKGILEVIKGILEAFGKLAVVAQLFVVGIVVGGAGIWLLVARPF